MRRSEDSGGAAIRVRGVTVRYPGTCALSGVELTVERGTVYALLGRNGAGKTSLVRCLLGHRRATRGTVEVLGRDAWRRRARILAEVGVVPEQPDAPPGMSAAALGRFFAALYPAWDGDGYDTRLARLAIPRRLPFRRLSRGQKAQVGLALALSGRPRLLVLDDPTLGLDAAARRAVFDELIGELADRGTTVFLATHDLAGVEGIADRVGVLEAGRLVLDEPLEELKARFRRLRASGRGAGEAGPAAVLEPLHVRRRPWGAEAVVARYDAAALGGPGAAGWEEGPALTLEEIFLAVTRSAEGEETP